MVIPMSRTPGSDDHNDDTMILTELWWPMTYEQGTRQWSEDRRHSSWPSRSWLSFACSCDKIINIIYNNIISLIIIIIVTCWEQRRGWREYFRCRPNKQEPPLQTTGPGPGDVEMMRRIEQHNQTLCSSKILLQLLGTVLSSIQSIALFCSAGKKIKFSK